VNGKIMLHSLIYFYHRKGGCVSVCLGNIYEKLWMNFHEIFGRDRPWGKKQSVIFYFVDDLNPGICDISDVKKLIWW